MKPNRQFCAPDASRLFREWSGRLRSALRSGDRPREAQAVSRRVSIVLRTGLVTLIAVSLTGCGKTVQHTATEQLVLSDEVDRSVSSIDFTPLTGAKCFLDESHLKSVKLTTVVNASYVTSSLRNQMVAAGCVLVEEREKADVVVEARLGALGADDNEVTYGIPSSNLLSQAASVMTAAPAIPTIPEISLAKKDDQMGAAKIAVFAYHAKTGNPIWQSGMAIARSSARNVWVFGIGPFQSGTIYESPQFAGARMTLPLAGRPPEPFKSAQVISLNETFLFEELPPPVPPASEESKTAMIDSKEKTE